VAGRQWVRLRGELRGAGRVALLVSVTNERQHISDSTPQENDIPVGQREMAARLATPAGQALYRQRGGAESHPSGWRHSRTVECPPGSADSASRSGVAHRAILPESSRSRGQCGDRSAAGEHDESEQRHGREGPQAESEPDREVGGADQEWAVYRPEPHHVATPELHSRSRADGEHFRLVVIVRDEATVGCADGDVVPDRAAGLAGALRVDLVRRSCDDSRRDDDAAGAGGVSARARHRPVVGDVVGSAQDEPHHARDTCPGEQYERGESDRGAQDGADPHPHRSSITSAWPRRQG